MSWRAAIKQLVIDVGGHEAMSRAMWPHRDPKKGAVQIANWLNADRRNKPDLEDIEAMLWIGRLRGHHGALFALCESLNYTQPTPVDPRQRLTLLQEQMQQQQRTLKGITDAMIRAQQDIDAIARSAGDTKAGRV